MQLKHRREFTSRSPEAERGSYLNPVSLIEDNDERSQMTGGQNDLADASRIRFRHWDVESFTHDMHCTAAAVNEAVYEGAMVLEDLKASNTRRCSGDN